MLLQNAIEAGTRAGGQTLLVVYEYASHVNHCWSGNIYLRSEAAQLGTVDGGYGSYYRFSLVALLDIPADTELVLDYRLAPWFFLRTGRRGSHLATWACPRAERREGVLSVGDDILKPLPWETVV